MSVEIDGVTYYYTKEALNKIGISEATFYRWLKQGEIEDVKHKHSRTGRRLFTNEDIQHIRNYAHGVTTT